MLKALQNRTNHATLSEASDVQHARQHSRLARNDPHGAALQSSESNHDIGSEPRLQLEEILAIDYSLDDLANVVGDLGVGRNHVVEFRIVFQRLYARPDAEGLPDCWKAGSSRAGGRASVHLHHPLR